MRKILLFTIIVLATFGSACNYAQEGSVSVETYKGQIVGVHYPGDSYQTWYKPYAAAMDVDISPWNDDIVVHVGTSDNAGLKLTIKVIGRVKIDKENVRNYLSSFGLDTEKRHEKRKNILSGAVQTITRDAVAVHTAYNLYKEQQNIQKAIEETLRPVVENQIFSELVSVQIVDRPDFDNDDIEMAASKVVAAQKEKEAQEQYKQAAQIELEKNEIVNRIYQSSPQAFELKKLEWQKYIAEAWAQNHAPIVFGSGNLQVQVPTK
jgi:SPFH domain / Band 7 family.